MKRWICSLLLVLGMVSSGWFSGLIIVDEAHWKHQLPPDGIVPLPWPSPRPRPEPWPRPWPVPPPRIYQFCPLEVTRHQASVRINDQLAATSIEQEFYNPNDQRIEGTFLFPIPKGAQIKKFAMEIKRHGANKATLGYEARNVKPDADFQIFFAPEADDIGVNLMTYRTSSDDGYFLLLASPGIDPHDKKVVPKDVAFVLDTSGSMAGKKLDQAKKALLFCVENLNEDDDFEIIRFSTETEPLFNKLTEASKANRSRANDFIKELKPIGGTAIDDALRKALALRSEKADRPFVVIFLTDGLPTIGNTDENQIVANAKQNSGGNVRVFCFGIGHDVNTHLLDKITEETRAFSQYVLPEEDIEVKVSNFFAKIKDPVLTNPALAFTGDLRTS